MVGGAGLHFPAASRHPPPRARAPPLPLLLARGRAGSPASFPGFSPPPRDVAGAAPRWSGLARQFLEPGRALPGGASRMAGRHRPVEESMPAPWGGCIGRHPEEPPEKEAPPPLAGAPEGMPEAGLDGTTALGRWDAPVWSPPRLCKGSRSASLSFRGPLWLGV